MDRIIEETAGVIVGIAILVIFGMIAATLYFVIAYIIHQQRYSAYKKRAEAEFDEEAARAGLDLPAEEIINAVYGVGVDLPKDGYNNVGEWAAGSLFGVEQYQEVA